MAEYINKAELMQYLQERLYTVTMIDVNNMTTINTNKATDIYLEEIRELNEENNKLFKENKELKDKLHEIHCISRGGVLDELHKEETK